MPELPERLATEFHSTAPEDTARLAAKLAAAIPPGTTIALIGTLGAGKTFFAQSFAAACGIPANAVVSPTFIICQQYAADRFSLNHLDVYRLNDGEEFIDLGVEEMMESDSVQLIEWADQVSDYLPEERIEITLEVTGEHDRTIRMVAIGNRLATVLKDL